MGGGEICFEKLRRGNKRAALTSFTWLRVWCWWWIRWKTERKLSQRDCDHAGLAHADSAMTTCIARRDYYLNTREARRFELLERKTSQLGQTGPRKTTRLTAVLDQNWIRVGWWPSVVFVIHIAYWAPAVQNPSQKYLYGGHASGIIQIRGGPDNTTIL